MRAPVDRNHPGHLPRNHVQRPPLSLQWKRGWEQEVWEGEGYGSTGRLAAGSSFGRKYLILRARRTKGVRNCGREVPSSPT